MAHLDAVSVEDLQRALAAVEGKKPAMRLLAGIAYKNGLTQTELAEWYGVERRTIYRWLTRLDSRPLPAAAMDEPRSGRPRKLTGDEQKRLESLLRNPPVEAGYDERVWTPALLQRFLDEEFGTTYSLPSCRRLMREAGLRYRRPDRVTSGRTDHEGRDGEPDGAGWRWAPE